MIVKNPKFEISAVRENQYPKNGLPEVVLVGKSNVGKSSFINTMINRKKLARTSSEPGKTRQLNFYNIDDLNEEQRIDISALQEVYGNTEYLPMMFLGRGRTRCKLGELDWDMAIGMATRGLRWIGQGW